MIVLFILIGLSLIVALIFLFLYIWSVKDGQYDDGHTPAIRMLFDDNEIQEEVEKQKEGTNITKINSETN